MLRCFSLSTMPNGIPSVIKGGMMTALSEWANFYVIVGSSAGTLIGLQVVVMTLG
jgi:hypothetical protein